MKKILVVDDEAESRDLISAILSDQGYQVFTAENGRAAIPMVRNHAPDAVVADVLMPEIDGYELFKIMKSDPWMSGIPVIILTARAKMEDSFRAVGAQYFLTKPVQADRLLAEIGRALREEGWEPVKPAGATAADAESAEKPEERTHIRRKVVIFGTDPGALKDMSGQLDQAGCVALVVLDTRQIARAVNAVQPELVLLQLVADTEVPFEQLVASLHRVFDEKIKKYGRRLYDPHLIVYEVEDPGDNLTSMSERIASVDNVLDSCRRSGEVDFIGPYSSISFLGKMEEFLKD